MQTAATVRVCMHLAINVFVCYYMCACFREGVTGKGRRGGVELCNISLTNCIYRSDRSKSEKPTLRSVLFVPARHPAQLFRDGKSAPGSTGSPSLLSGCLDGGQSPRRLRRAKGKKTSRMIADPIERQTKNEQKNRATRSGTILRKSGMQCLK